jgi:formylglycine-generating enzyme required for sulfatase activity
MRVSRPALFAIVLVTTSACAGLIGIEDRFFEASEAGTEAGPDTNGETSVPPDAGDAGDARPDGPCPENMILAKTFCIDGTEVTQRAYQKFLDVTKGDASNQIAQCATANTSFSPPGSCAPFAFDPQSEKPMACVDWCDAYAYCAWAGKRLCGLVDGGTIPTDASPKIYESNDDQWFAACSEHGLRTFPYGAQYDGSVCNGNERWDGSTPATSWPAGAGECIGGYEGLRDMSGNVVEWQDACQLSASVDGGVECLKRGGGFNDNAFFAYFTLVCGARSFSLQTVKSPDLGFRCCSP